MHMCACGLQKHRDYLHESADMEVNQSELKLQATQQLLQEAQQCFTGKLQEAQR